MDFLLSIFEKVLPPMSRVQTWRTVMAVMVLALCVHAAWAIGWIPGLDGFAQSATVVELKTNLERNVEGYKESISKIEETQNSILARLIASDIEFARGAQCNALAEKNVAGASGWRVKLDSALYEYRSITRRDYSVRPCDEY